MNTEGTLIAFLGDELTALGYRLAGVECHHPDPAGVAERFAELCRRARLILITAEAADVLGPAELLRAQAAESPLVVVIPDVRRRRDPPDRAAAVRRQLGMAQ
jgi:vacuolar-type H+-ATPase subunit F/Vma7